MGDQLILGLPWSAENGLLDFSTLAYPLGHCALASSASGQFTCLFSAHVNLKVTLQ
jgi:hypothetical protein